MEISDSDHSEGAYRVLTATNIRQISLSDHSTHQNISKYMEGLARPLDATLLDITRLLNRDFNISRLPGSRASGRGAISRLGIVSYAVESRMLPERCAPHML